MEEVIYPGIFNSNDSHYSYWFKISKVKIPKIQQ